MSRSISCSTTIAATAISDFDGQTNWETRFLNAGMRIAFDEDTRLLAQAMSGRTIWGYRTPMGYWVDVDFNSAYVLLARDFDVHRVAGRLDYFEIGDRSFVDIDNNDEEGWAATAAYQLERHAFDHARDRGLCTFPANARPESTRARSRTKRNRRYRPRCSCRSDALRSSKVNFEI